MFYLSAGVGSGRNPPDRRGLRWSGPTDPPPEGIEESSLGIAMVRRRRESCVPGFSF